MNHEHDLELSDWRTCVCGKSFKSSRSLHLHVTKANRAAKQQISSDGTGTIANRRAERKHR